MTITPNARDHLFDAISRQYDPEDAETLKVLLMSLNHVDLATRQDVGALRNDFVEFRAELRADFADFRAEMHQALYQQTRTYISWMFGLLTAYTAMSGSLVAIATIIIR